MGVPIGFLHQSAYGRPANRMSFGNSSQRHPGAAITNNLLPIDIQPRTTDLASFKPSPSHARFYPLHHERSLKLRYRRDDGHEQTSHRIPGRHAFSAAAELDAHTVQLVDDLQEIPCASRNAVERRYQHYGELLSPGVSHERIEPRTPCLLSTNTTIFVLVDNLVALLRCQLAEIVELTFDVLVGRAHSDIERNFFHPICSSTYNKADLVSAGDG